MKRYALRVGEPLAIASTAIKHDADGFFLTLGDGPAPENEAHGSVVVVKIRGALVHFKGDGGDSYEAIVERVGEAFASDPKPTSVVLRIESPGGVVAGLNETVFKLQRMSRAAKIPLIAFVDEMAASAAYALCCSCSEILAPPSGVIGSVGVISTMVSTAARDKADGIEFRLITSGKRKADGHLHAPISDDAERAERDRNAELANQFFDLVSKARSVSAAKLRSLEAAIYLGKRAKAVGLIDDVMNVDDALFGLGATAMDAETPPAPNGGNVTDRRAKVDASRNNIDTTRSTRSVTSTRSPMGVKLSALIRTTEAAIASEVDPKKLRALRADLSAFYATSAALDEDDDEDEDEDKKDDDKDGDEEESKSAKHAENAKKLAAKAKATSHRSKAAEHKAKAAEEEEEAKRCEEESSDDDAEPEARTAAPIRSALAALVENRTGLTGDAAIAGLMAEFAKLDRISETVTALKSKSDVDERAGLMAKASKYHPPHVLEGLKALGLSDLKAFVSKACKGEPMVVTEEIGLVKPRSLSSDSEASLPPERLAMIEAAMSSSFISDKKAMRAALVSQHIKDHNDQLKALNGGAVRY